MPKDKVDRGPEDCYRRLKDHFESDAWKQEHQGVRRVEEHIIPTCALQAGYKIKQIIIHWTGPNVIKRPSHYAHVDGVISLQTRKTIAVRPLTGATKNYSYLVVGRERVAVRRHSCWCQKCLNCAGKVVVETKPSDRADRQRETVADTCRIDGCPNGAMKRFNLETLDTASQRQMRKDRDEQGVRMARSQTPPLLSGVVFACATPPFAYRDAFELFEAADPGDGGPIVRELPEDSYIGGDKVKKGR